MRLEIKPNRWTCVPASFAMVLCYPLDWILAAVGHDGSEIIYPGLPEPRCRRGFHIQEMIDVCLKHGYAVTPIEYCPMSLHAPNVETCIFDDLERTPRLYDIINTSRGVLECLCLGGTGHMVAFDHGQICDPNGYEFKTAVFASRFLQPICAWRVDPISKKDPSEL